MLGAAIALLVAAPAEATLVYVKNAGDFQTRVWVAQDDGTQPRKVGLGHSPKHLGGRPLDRLDPARHARTS